MLSLIEQIKTGRLWDFPGGIHPPENKQQSSQALPVEAAIPHHIVLPLKQHIGKAGDLAVQVGDSVLKGQALTHYTSTFMLPVHAPTSGKVIAIEKRTVAHPSGLDDLCIVIQPDGRDQWIERQCSIDFNQLSPESLIEVIRHAGISGLGGAGFPTAKKIQSGLARTEILIVNGAECEPYITADDVLMQHYADEIIAGIEVMEHILKPKLVLIAVEDNKANAIEALNHAAKHKDYVIRVIPTKYPSGGEKQLIKVLTNQEVPNGRLPADIGIVVQNVGSLFAIKRAVIDAEPLIQRLVTLTGNCFQAPRNVWVRLGTPIKSLLEEFEYQEDKRHPRLIMGGPMMGFTLPHADVPITKTSNCILAPQSHELAVANDEMACIRCGQCAEACPASLLPQQLFWHAKAQEHEKCEQLNLKDCIECGACAYVCPSEIPLVHYYRQAKAEIKTMRIEAQASERAKQRFEEKKRRLERDKAERENRFKQAADARRNEMKQSGGEDAIAAAIARVNAKKDQNTAEPKVKPAVAAAIAKAKAKQEAAIKAGAIEPDNQEMKQLREERKRIARERRLEKPEHKDSTATEPTRESMDPRKAAIEAAIARAKAKKAQAESPLTDSEPEPPAPRDSTTGTDDPKKAAVAAAIARAKAKKAQAESPSTDSEPEPPAPRDSTTGADDPKKAAVAAAIARAKAKKAQAESPPTDSEPEPPVPHDNTTGTDDPKKAAVAAAIARAKAKKAQQSIAPNTEDKGKM